jgi:hypothetical protein
MSAILLSSSWWFGYEATTFIIHNKFEYLIRISIGIPLGMTVQATFLFITSLIWPLNLRHSLCVACIFLSFSVFLALFNRRFKPSRRISYTVLELIVVIPITLFVMWGAYSANMASGKFTRGPAFADLPFHMNIISSFAHGINYNRTSLFDVWSCFQSDIPLAYPMFHNFYIACLLTCNDISFATALQVTAVPLAFAFVLLLYQTFWIFANDVVVAVISLPTWMTLGGLGWTMVFYPSFWRQSGNNWILRFSNSHHATWMQPLVQILIPQRSALFSAPLCLGCLLCFIKGVKKFERSFFVLAGFCTGFLPQVQVHSFVAVAQFAIGMCLTHFPSKSQFWKVFWTWFGYGLLACTIGLPLTYPFWIRKSENSIYFVHYRPLWADDVYGKLFFPLISVWWKSLGPFSLVMYLFGWVSATQRQLRIWGASMMVWFVTSFVRYQPWSMDNLKLLFAVWLPVAVPYVTQFYVWTWRHSQNLWIKWIIAFLMVQASWSSLLSWNMELWTRLGFVDDPEYRAGYWIAENTPVESVIMSYASRFNPATSFAGRQLFWGFISWIAQHGVAGPNRQLKTSELLTDTGNGDKFASEGIGYALVKWNHSLVFPLKANNQYWALVFEDWPYWLFKLYHPKIAPVERKRVNETQPPTPVPTPRRSRRPSRSRLRTAPDPET